MKQLTLNLEPPGPSAAELFDALGADIQWLAWAELVRFCPWCEPPNDNELQIETA